MLDRDEVLKALLALHTSGNGEPTWLCNLLKLTSERTFVKVSSKTSTTQKQRHPGRRKLLPVHVTPG